MSAGRLDAALAAIDAANSADPEVIEIDGAVRPKEQAHAELMTEWVRRLDPAASDEQLLAARAHHLRRWVVPRSTYPEGRAGYLRWRADAARRQAVEVGEILTSCGYDEASVARVQAIIRKEGRTTDPAVQVHEDALCLVFLSTQLDATAARLGDDKAAEVIRKTARKMSPRGRAAAAGLPLSDQGRALVTRALS